MIEQSVSLASNGVIKVPGYEQLVRFGYTKNRGVYRLAVTASGEWEGLTIRAFWHVPDGKDPESSLVVDGYVAVPASVTAQPGSGCITFEGSDGAKAMTSADLRYRVSANSGTEDGTEPEPGTPAWQQLVDAVHADATAAEQAKTDAQTAASEAATNAGSANQSAQKAAGSLQELKDSIANGDFKGEKGDPGPAGVDGKDAPQIDDTTVTDSAPWSSKHIVDMLCPPLEETGNTVQCYPVVGYSLGVKATWEPVQEGSGEPSPDNIRPISGRDAVKVERCGENLLHIKPFDKNTYSGITYEYVANGGVHISGTSTGNVNSPHFAVWHLPPGSYRGPDFGTGISVAIIIYRNGADRWVDAARAFKVLAGDVTKYLYMIVTSGTTLDTTVYPYIVPGTAAPTTYTPYTGQTATLTLPRTIYGGTVDAVTGEGRERWKLLTLDGTEPWNAVGSGDALYFQSTSISIGTRALSRDDYCTTFPIASVSGSNTVQGVNGWNTSLYLRWSTFADVAALKSYLAAQYAAGTPVQVCYKLATPTPFTATGAQPIPALRGVNTVLTDADSVTVTGRADPIKRITDLEDAVASMTTT
nr:MAG TPA: hypothetical protein [Caudoviricetes sp.]